MFLLFVKKVILMTSAILVFLSFTGAHCGQHSLTQSFCQTSTQAIIQQFDGRTSYVM